MLGGYQEFAEAAATDYAQVKTPDLGGVGNSIEAPLWPSSRRRELSRRSGNETDYSAQVSLLM
jgi:methylaspartate ammonia-lyase